MLPDRVSNPEPLTYESGALPIALRGPAIYLVHSEINRYNQPYQIISRIVKYQLFVINIINLLGALYLISIKLFLILISKLVPLTPETVRTLIMFIQMRVMLLRAI